MGDRGRAMSGILRIKTLWGHHGGKFSVPLVKIVSQAITRHLSLHYPTMVQQPHPSYCPNAPLIASEPAVAPAPKIAALPNFFPAFLSHSPCLSRLACPLSTILRFETRAYMGMVRVSRMIWVFRVLSILLSHLRWLFLVGHTVRKRISDSSVYVVVGLGIRRLLLLLLFKSGLTQSRLYTSLRDDVNEDCDATSPLIRSSEGISLHPPLIG